MPRMSQDDIQLSVCHLGYRSDSPKTVTLVSRTPLDLPESVPYFIRQNCIRMPRDVPQPEGFSVRFPAPYDLLSGKLLPKPGTFVRSGTLKRKSTRWGTVWQDDFSEFREFGSWQIETDLQISAPFMIADWVYDRLARGFLTFLHAQRCGFEVPGVHPACHLDDGVLDTDGSHWPSTGGWHDAGDFRKWLCFTQGNLEALTLIHERGHAGFREAAVSEMGWGNRFFHQMLTGEGRVFEDVAGGRPPKGHSFTYDEHWWFENHPGCYGDATDNRWTDNIPHSGDERMVRTTYNPQIQFAFVQTQARVARCLTGSDSLQCRSFAERAWAYGRRNATDRRTLFVATELMAALEMSASGLGGVGEIRPLVNELLSRQDAGRGAIHGFFCEKDGSDAYRSFAYAGTPAWTLLRLVELDPKGLEDETRRAREALERHVEGYLAADATSNPFDLTPYGVYFRKEQETRQVFRDAGEGRGIRTFVHPFNSQGIVHGTSSVLLSHAAVLAKGAVLLNRPEWRRLAEKQIQWTAGNNTVNRSLYIGIGYRQPIAYGYRVTQIPEGSFIGFNGRPDDSPYLEESFAIEWNNLEHWDVPFMWGICASAWF